MIQSIKISRFLTLTTLLVSTVMLSSCGSSKEITRTRHTPSTSTENKKPDTQKPKKVEVVEVDEKEYPPIKSPTGIKDVSNNLVSEKKDLYRVKIIMPITSSSHSTSNALDDEFVQYYAGMRMALEEAQRNNLNLVADIVDIGSQNVDQIIKNELSDNIDLVVGPYSKNDVEKLETYCKKNQISFISPWRTSSKIAEKDPYYMQIQPNIKERYYKMINHIANNYNPDEVVIVSRDTIADKNLLHYLDEISKSNFKTKGEQSIQKFQVNKDTLSQGLFAFEDLFEKGKKVFVFPQYKFEDEDFLYNSMRRMAVEKQNNTVKVYGLPILKDSEKISYDYYSALNMHIVVSEFVDQDNPEVVDFRRRFFNEYGAIANSDAMEGYDLMGYVILGLERYGKNFQFSIEDKVYNGIQTKIKLMKRYNDDEVNEDYENFDYYENGHLDIISFIDGKFRIID